MARREWQEQKRLARLLQEWLDPACTFWTATDPVASSALSGAIRKQRGVKPGVPDVLVWYRGKSIAIELKSRRGQCSRSQRAVREAMLRAGAQWWVCRSARAAMPEATFVTRPQPLRLPARAARQLPDQSTTPRVESSSTGNPRLRGALP